MSEKEKLKNVSPEAKKLFEVATSSRKCDFSEKVFTFFYNIDDACFVLLESGAVLDELNRHTALLNELLNVEVISKYTVVKKSYNELQFNVEL